MAGVGNARKISLINLVRPEINSRIGQETGRATIVITWLFN